MTLAQRTQALLELIEEDRRARCAILLEEAHAQARQTTAQAHARALLLVRQAHAEERQRREAQVAAARAELATRQRLHTQRRIEALLEEGWQLLPAVLQRRWAAPATRQRWVEAALQAATGTLPPRGWILSHAPDWPEHEREACLDGLARQLGQRPEARPDPAILAGLRIAAAGNVVDATLDGLLADREDIGGRLVAGLGPRAGEAA